MGSDGSLGAGAQVEARTGWWRLDHEGLALPVPAVYLPAEDLHQPDLGRLGFGSLLDTASGERPIPLSRHIMAVVDDPDRLALMVSRHELYQLDGPAVAISEDRGSTSVTGQYTEPADRDWQRAVQKARSLILIAGTRPAAEGSTGVPSPQEWLLSKETLFGLMFGPTTMMAAVAVGALGG